MNFHQSREALRAKALFIVRVLSGLGFFGAILSAPGADWVNITCGALFGLLIAFGNSRGTLGTALKAGFGSFMATVALGIHTTTYGVDLATLLGVATGAIIFVSVIVGSVVFDYRTSVLWMQQVPPTPK